MKVLSKEFDLTFIDNCSGDRQEFWFIKELPEFDVHVVALYKHTLGQIQPVISAEIRAGATFKGELEKLWDLPWVNNDLEILANVEPQTVPKWADCLRLRDSLAASWGETDEDDDDYDRTRILTRAVPVIQEFIDLGLGQDNY